MKLFIGLTGDNMVTVMAVDAAGNPIGVQVKLDREAAIQASRELDKLGRMLPQGRKRE